MASLLNQIGAVTVLNVRSIPQRGAMSIASVVAVALTIAVLLFFLALSNGLQRTVEGSGADDVAVVIRSGSNAELNSVVTRDQLNILATGPGVVSRNGAPSVSGELLVIVDGVKRDTGTNANMPFRGIGPEGLALRRGVTIAQGRMFTPGTNEIRRRRRLAARVQRLRVWQHDPSAGRSMADCRRLRSAGYGV